MMVRRFEPLFVEFVPEQPAEGNLYLSMAYRTAIHLCACGCGATVATPFSPADWRVEYDGESVTLKPSIGNWQLPCRSHYLIRRNEVVWAGAWSRREIAVGRAADDAARASYFEAAVTQEPGPPAAPRSRLRTFTERLRKRRPGSRPGTPE